MTPTDIDAVLHLLERIAADLAPRVPRSVVDRVAAAHHAIAHQYPAQETTP